MVRWPRWARSSPPAGASAGTGGDTAGAPAKSAEGLTLRVNYRSEEYIPPFLTRYTEQNPNVKIEPIANSGYEKLQALIDQPR